MISVPPGYVTAAKANARICLGTLDLTVNGVTTTLTKNEIQEFTVERSACSSSTFTLGSTVASTLHMTVLTSSLAGFATLDGVMVEPYMGFEIAGVPTLIQEGVFWIDDSQTKDMGLFTQLVAYDVFMSAVMDEAIDPLFATATFDAALPTYDNFSGFASVYTGLSFDYSLVDTTGDTPVIIEDTMTVREVLSRLAVAAGCNLIASNTGTITCAFPATEPPDLTTIDAALQITPNEYKSCDIDGKDKTFITYVSCNVVGDSGSYDEQYPDAATVESLAPGSVGLSFDNTYFSDTSALQTVYGRFMPYQFVGEPYRNLHYQGHTLTIKGMPYIEPFDGMSVERTMKGVTTTDFIVPFTIRHTYNGGLSTTISAKTIQKTEAAQTSIAARIASSTKVVSDKVAALQEQTTAVYGTCDTSSATIDKDVVLDGFTLYAGAGITVRFAFTNQVSAPTMNVNGTGTFPIYANNAPLNYPSTYTWNERQLVSFVFAPAGVVGGVSLPDRWAMVNANPANFCDFIDDGNGGKVLRISTDATAGGFHTDIGADAITLNNGAQTNLRIDNNNITIGTSPTQQLAMSSGGLVLTNGSSQVTMASSQVTLSSGGASSLTVLDSSRLDTPIVRHQQAMFTNPNSNAYTYVIEHRSNGHLSFKVYEGSE
ncbi:MAG: hypothetical protein J6S63_01225 [Atopobiaceae bacterium]|nr:hypothetical protein [Atopobiaceae bacterium]